MSDHLLGSVLDDAEARLRGARNTQLGQPYNLVGKSPTRPGFSDYLINNLSDPYAGSPATADVCDLEREVIATMRECWQCDERDDYWGSVSASGTEANLLALYMAREALPNSVLLHSVEAHSSVPRAARMLQMETIAVPCDPSGAILIEALSHRLGILNKPRVIVALTCGTPMKGAHDDIAEALHFLDVHGFDRQRRFVHVDGGLNAMVLPFVKDAPTEIYPSFSHEIDSISTCGHKMIGTPMPCGVLVVRKHHAARVSPAASGLRANDASLIGSRNGHAVLALWSILKEHGRQGFEADVALSLKRADTLEKALSNREVPVHRNAHSLTVVFPQPSDAIVRKYQLAVHQGKAHAVVMPSVTEELLLNFCAEYLGWWSGTCASSVKPSATGHARSEQLSITR